MGHLEDLPGSPRFPAVRRDWPDLGLAGLPTPTDLAESWQVNLTDELTRRDRTAQGRFDPAAFTHNALHQVTTRTGALPASYTWDVNGNLSTRTGGLYGDASFTHDWRDRLVQVAQGGATTDIILDPLGRMVGKVRHAPEGDVARAYPHDGDQVVLEYVQPAGGTTWQPERRHIWGRWIDDLVLEQVDTDGGGTLDATLYPVTDLLGSAQLLTDESGAIAERITYDPDGTPHFWSADTTRPTATRIAWTGDGATPTGDTVTAQAFELGFSEPIDPESVAAATATLTPDGGPPQTLTITLAADGRATYLTGAAVQPGTQYALHVDGLTDTSGNPIWPVDTTVTVSDPDAYEVLNDTTAPQLLAVLDGSDALYLLFDEPIQPATGFDLDTAITLTRQGQPVEGAATRLTANLLKWQPTAEAGPLIPDGTYTLAAPHLQDFAGNALTAPTALSFTHLTTTPDLLLLAYQAPSDTQRENQSAYGLTTLFQGRTWHADLGAYYYRARWYLPDAGVFAERDPLSYLESPNLTQSMNSAPVQNVDPLGEGWKFDLEYGPFGNKLEKDQAAREARRRAALRRWAGNNLKAILYAAHHRARSYQEVRAKAFWYFHDVLGLRVIDAARRTGSAFPLRPSDLSYADRQRLTMLREAGRYGEALEAVAEVLGWLSAGGVDLIAGAELAPMVRAERVLAPTAEVPELAEIVDQVTGGPLLKWNEFQHLYAGEGLNSTELAHRYRIYQATGIRERVASEMVARVLVPNAEYERYEMTAAIREIMRDSALADDLPSAIEVLLRALNRSGS